MGAPSSNPYQQSYGPPQTMNYYGGQQGYGGGGQYGEPPMPNYSQNSGYYGGQQNYGGGDQRDDRMRLRQADPRWQAAQNRSQKPVWLVEGGQGESYESFKNREAQVKAQNPEQWATWEREDALAATRPTRPPYADQNDF